MSYQVETKHLSNDVAHYGLRSDFLYYNQMILQSRGDHLFTNCNVYCMYCAVGLIRLYNLTLLISWCICLFPPSPAQLITFLVIMFWLIIGKLMPLLYTFLSSYVQTSISRYISSAVQSIVKSADGCIIHLRLNLFYNHLVLRLFIDNQNCNQKLKFKIT
jgi:ABC-type transport system involved in cytochrome c biogenesis permease subunit